MGEWREVKPFKDDGNPCRNCEMGFASYCYKEEGGKKYVKTDHCQETCARFKAWRGIGRKVKY